MVRDQAPAASSTASARVPLIVADTNAADPATCALDRAHGRVLVQPPAGRDERLLQRQHEATIVDLVIVRAVDRGEGTRVQMRLAGARLPAGQPGQVDAEAALEVEGKAQLLDVVAGQRDHQRAFLAQADVDPGGALELGGEIGPAALRLPVQREQGLLAGLGSRRLRPACRPRPSWRRARPRRGRTGRPCSRERPAASRPPGPRRRRR